MDTPQMFPELRSLFLMDRFSMDDSTRSLIVWQCYRNQNRIVKVETLDAISNFHVSFFDKSSRWRSLQLFRQQLSVRWEHDGFIRSQSPVPLMILTAHSHPSNHLQKSVTVAWRRSNQLVKVGICEVNVDMRHRTP